jgi:hypothetical protein
VGPGPFKLKNYVRGSYIEMERNPDYWKKGLPYMNAVTYFIIKDTSARAKAIRSGRVDVEFRRRPDGSPRCGGHGRRCTRLVVADTSRAPPIIRIDGWRMCGWPSGENSSLLIAAGGAHAQRVPAILVVIDDGEA